MNPDRRSLKVRLLALAAASIAATLFVAGVSLVIIFERHIERRIGDELTVRWTDLAGAVALEADGRLVFTRPLADPLYARPLSGAYWQIDADGQPLQRSRSLWDDVLVLPRGRTGEAPFEILGPDGALLYVVSHAVTLGTAEAPRTLVLTVALDHREITALSDAFAGDLTRALLVIAVVLFAGAWLQASVGLQPLAALRRAIGDVRGGASERLGDGFPTEIQPLADDLDRLLDRHADLLRKARDRAGALAHGFKTPLTILVLEARRLDEEGKHAAARRIRDQAESMRRLVERELARARVRGAPAGGDALGGVVTADLEDTVRRLVDLVRRMPFAEALRFTVDVPTALQVRVDPGDLGEVVGNLLDNARKWARSEVTVRATVEGAFAVVDVIDDGPGIAATVAGTAAEPARNADGSGLGLAIVADILGEYGGRVDLGETDGGGARVRLHLPLARPAGVSSTQAGARRTPPARIAAE